MQNKVSIIVPVYNCSQYLEKCITSLICQTYKNLEILLINDGSTDGSLSCCEDFAQRDSRVLVINQANQGVSKTRNQGIEMASGEYLMFVDGDDYIKEDMVEVLLTAALNHKAEASICGIIHSHPDKPDRIFPSERVSKVVTGKEAVKEILMNHIVTAGPVCKLFIRSSVPKDMFPLDLTVGEDAVGVINAIYGLSKVAFDTKPEYIYNHREGSLMSSSFSKQDLDLILAYERVNSLYGKEPLLREACEFREIWSHFHVLDKAMEAGCEKQKVSDVIAYLRKHALLIMKNSYVGKMRKVSMLALLIHWRLYRRVLRMR